MYHAVNHYVLIKELCDVGVSCCKPLCIDKGALGRWYIMLCTFIYLYMSFGMLVYHV